MRKSLVDTTFKYGVGADAAELNCTIPVHHCSECDFEFTDYEAEDIRESVVEQHLRRTASR